MWGRRQPDQRTICRIYDAASKVEVANFRQASVLGGIVASLVELGQFDHKYAGAKTVALLEHHAVDGQYTRELEDHHNASVPRFQFHNRLYPSGSEMTVMVQAFQRHYNPPTGVAA